MVSHITLILQFHEDKDVTQYCALSRATRLSYILCDHFCMPMGIEIKAGKHLPRNADLTSLASPFASQVMNIQFFFMVSSIVIDGSCV